MPQQTFYFQGEYYDIPENRIQEFQQEMPLAEPVQKYIAKGKTYRLPVSKIEPFLQEFPSAKPAETKTSKQGFIGPRQTPEMRETIAAPDYQPEAGISDITEAQIDETRQPFYPEPSEAINITNEDVEGFNQAFMQSLENMLLDRDESTAPLFNYFKSKEIPDEQYNLRNLALRSARGVTTLPTHLGEFAKDFIENPPKALGEFVLTAAKSVSNLQTAAGLNPVINVARSGKAFSQLMILSGLDPVTQVGRMHGIPEAEESYQQAVDLVWEYPVETFVGALMLRPVLRGGVKAMRAGETFAERAPRAAQEITRTETKVPEKTVQEIKKVFNQPEQAEPAIVEWVKTAKDANVDLATLLRDKRIPNPLKKRLRNAWEELQGRSAERGITPPPEPRQKPTEPRLIEERTQRKPRPPEERPAPVDEPQLVQEQYTIKGRSFDVYRNPDRTFDMRPRGPKGVRKQWTEKQFERHQQQKRRGRRVAREQQEGKVQVTNTQVESAPALREVVANADKFQRGELQVFESIRTNINALIPESKLSENVQGNQFDNIPFDEMPGDFREQYPHLRQEDGYINQDGLIQEAAREVQWLIEHPGETLPTFDSMQRDWISEQEAQFNMLDEQERVDLDRAQQEQQNFEEVANFFEEKAKDAEQQREEQFIEEFGERVEKRQPPAEEGVVGEDVGQPEGAVQPADRVEPEPGEAGADVGEAGAPGEAEPPVVAAEGQRGAGRPEQPARDVGDRPDRDVEPAELREILSEDIAQLKAQRNEIQSQIDKVGVQMREGQQRGLLGPTQADQADAFGGVQKAGAQRVKKLREDLDRVNEQISKLQEEQEMLSFVEEAGAMQEIFNSEVYRSSPEETRKEIEQRAERIQERINDLLMRTDRAEVLEDLSLIYQSLLQEYTENDIPVQEITHNPQSKAGKKLIQKIRKDTDGEKVGVRSMAEFLDEQLGTETRVGKTQLSGKNPAHYEVTPRLIRSRAQEAGFMFHEQGHDIYQTIIEDNKQAFRGVAPVLKAVAEMDGSMASAQTTAEGFAEWIRRYVVRYNSIKDFNTTQQIESMLEADYPEILKALQDAQTAYSIHSQRSDVAIQRSYSSDLPTDPLKNVLSTLKDRVAYAAARGWALDKVKRDIFRAIRDAARDMEMSREEAVKYALEYLEEIPDSPNDFIAAHQDVVGIPAEIQAIMDGPSGENGGIRVKDMDGNYIQFSEDSWISLKKDIGEERWPDFEQYVFARSSLARWEEEFLNRKKLEQEQPELYQEFVKEGQFQEAEFAEAHPGRYDQYSEPRQLDYPGRLDEIPPERLRRIIRTLESEHTDFPAIAARANDFFDALLEVAVEGGMFTREEATRMQEAYGFYVPLMRNITRDGAFERSGGNESPSTGITYARGSFKGYMELDAQAQRRIRNVITAYYWNQSMQKLVNAVQHFSRDTDLPREAQAEIGRIAVRLHPETTVKARLSESEAVQIREEIAEYINEENALLGEGETEVKAEDIQIHLEGRNLYRKTDPNAINVIAPSVEGQRQFYQIKDPILWDLYAGSRNPGELIKWYTKVLRPPSQVFRRMISRTAWFGVRNIFRDAPTAMMFGEGAESWIPFGYAWMGAINRLTGKYPQAKKHGELLMRSLEATGNPKHKIHLSKFQDILTEGFEPIENWKTLSAPEKAAELPGLAVNFIAKPLDILLFYTGQVKFTETLETLSREGRAVQTIKQGQSEARVNLAYQEVTGNFGEHSGSPTIRSLLQTLPFVGAGINVTYRMALKATEPGPAKWRFILGMATKGTLFSAMLFAIKVLLSNEEDWERESERPTEDRASHMDIKGVRIPFDYGPVGAVQSLTFNTLQDETQDMRIRDKKAFARQILKRLGDFPGSPMDWMQPQIRAWTEMDANKSFYFDTYIVPPLMENLPAEDQKYITTPKFYQKVGEVFNMSPIKIQYFINNTGFRQYNELTQLVEQVADGGKLREPSDIPFAGRLFIRNPVGWLSASVREVEKQNSTITQRIKEKMSGVVKYDINEKGIVPVAIYQLNKLSPSSQEYQTLEAELQAYFIWDKAMKDINRLQSQINTITKKHELSPEDIRKIEEYKYAMRTIAKQTVNAHEWFQTDPGHDEFLEQYREWKQGQAEALD